MAKVLFVDDEPAIVKTLGQILELNGFETKTASSVSEALSLIMSEKFDVLISDLNIGEPADGFIVVSAEHRVDPSCRTIILTGYPGFETALQALRAQVDDYIIKPAHIPDLIETIRRLLTSPPKKLPVAGKRLSAILREHSGEIIEKTIHYMMADPQLGALGLNRSDRVDHLPREIERLAELLEFEHPEIVPAEAMRDANVRGRLRHAQRFTSDMVVSEVRMFLTGLNEVVEENLLVVDMSHIVRDSKWVRESVLQQLAESVRALNDAERQLTES
jgi:YesN/AraC family two-component response regulator